MLLFRYLHNRKLLKAARHMLRYIQILAFVLLEILTFGPARQDGMKVFWFMHEEQGHKNAEETQFIQNLR
jgi:hypothetical protein